VRTQDLFNFVQERYAVLQRRQAGLPKPWTQDPIIQSYRFCNVYREDDTVTQWIKENWRDPNADDPNVWFAMAAARFINWPDSLAEVGYPVPWDAACANFIHKLADRAEAGKKVWTGAYVIHAGKGGSKIGHVAYDILTALWERRDYVLDGAKSCALFNKRLMEFDGIGSFMAGQITCDTKYTRLLDTALDWWDFATPGPGSQRGLARVFEYPVKHRWHDDLWLSGLLMLKSQIGPLVLAAGMPPLHAQDLQNCLCEFDKYERVRLNEGRPRNNYPGAR
jgi:alpha-glutamyl/putrescinyl thymine pyrophosphorylase clade 1